ncbi:APC family permease [Pseudonocardia halophobica]|uniref:APC family permease n=1 Tax=Pseudonocardia halophobica TaxID=29401 RepID=UPI003D8EE4B8
MRDEARLRLRSRSPVEGLERRRLGPLEVFAQSVSGAAPSAAMAATPAIVAVSAGHGTVWSFAIATVLALLVAGCIARFTRRMAASGGLYSLTAKGLTPAAAYASALASLLGYGLLAAGALVGATLYLQALLDLWGAGGGRLGAAVVMAAVGLGTGVLVLRGARLSARVVLLAESISITLMLVVFSLLLAGGPASGTAGGGEPVEATAMPPPGFGGIVAGVLPALAAFIGFEIATSLGTEVRKPFRSVPRAVGLTAAVAGVLYVFAAQVQVFGFSATPGGLAGQAEPVVALAAAKGWGWLPVLLDLGLVMSFVACGLATATALARVLFSLSRDGVAPQAFGRTHRRFRTPHLAVLASVPVTTGVPVVLLAVGVPLPTVLVTVLTLAACGFLLAYLLVCAAAPVFLHRIGELTWPAVAVSAVIVPILLVVLVAFVVTRPLSGLLLAGLAVLGAAGYLVVRLKRPAALAGIGVYDETTTADVLIPDRGAA